MSDSRARRSRRQPGPEVEAEPPPDSEDRIDGVLVIEIAPVVQRGREVPGRELLFLADGTQTVRCTDCGYLGSNGAVAVHRGRTHAQADSDARTLPIEALSITVGELLHLAGGVAEWEALFNRQAQENAAVVEKLQAALADEKARRRQAESELRRFNTLLGRAGFKKVEGEN